MKSTKTSTGNSKVAIVAIVAVAALAGGSVFLFSQDTQPTSNAAPAQSEESNGFSFEYKDDDGEGVKFEGSSNE